MYIDHQTLDSTVDQFSWGLAISSAAIILGLIFTLAAPLIPMLSMTSRKNTPSWLMTGLFIAGIALFAGGATGASVTTGGGTRRLQETNQAIVHNLKTKYDVSEIELGPEPAWERSTIIDGKLSDGRRIVGGTVVLDDSGEPRIIGAVFDVEVNGIPLRK